MEYGISRRVLSLAGAVLMLFSMSVMAAADISGQIKERLTPLLGKSSGTVTIDSTKIPAGVAKFYEDGKFQPLWNDRARLAALIQNIEGLYSDGLHPADYSLITLKRYHSQLTGQQKLSAAQMANTDIVATDAYLRALLHLYHGKVDPSSLDSRWNFNLREMNKESGIRVALASARQGELKQVFDNARPPYPSYDHMRKALARLRNEATKGQWVVVPAGPALKPNGTDARVPLLRQRLKQTGLYTGELSDSQVYDAALADAVSRYQQQQLLTGDGIVGPATLKELNTPIKDRIDQLRVNLERARWVMHDLEGDFVLVDVAGYRIAYIKDGRVVWTSRVQVGKPYRSTPIFQSKVTYLTFNPTWTIPPTIFKQDTLPAIRKDRGYLTRNNMKVLNSKGEAISASSVNWNNPGNILIRQSAGPNNALGQMVIRFPNDYAIYLHDTPHQGLFGKDERATSSGCIRVERILELAELLLDDPNKWSQSGIQTELANGKTQNISLKTQVPILLAYWTVDITDSGVNFRPDIYDRDAGILKALGASQR